MLRQRLITAFVGLAVLILVILFGGMWGWAAFVALAGVLGAIEFYSMAGHSGARPLVLLGCLWIALLILSPLSLQSNQTAFLVSSAGLVASFVWLLAREHKEGALVSWAITLAGVLYIGWLSRYLVALRGLEDGRDWLLLAMFATFATDSTAYFIGRSWGRHPLAPKVSPAKTIEGAVAGLSGGIAAALLLGYLLDLPLSAWQALLLGLLVGASAQLGDLTESLFKRSLGAKDSGKLMPGHGGILDRADSILLSGIVVYYYVIYL
ncbi:MAG: phosphatidate cytidylyltransferase [Chloroflexota bacterium]